jgi:hypothetical protein
MTNLIVSFRNISNAPKKGKAKTANVPVPETWRVKFQCRPVRWESPYTEQVQATYTHVTTTTTKALQSVAKLLEHKTRAYTYDALRTARQSITQTTTLPTPLTKLSLSDKFLSYEHQCFGSYTIFGGAGGGIM